MFSALARKIFGSKNERELKRIYPLVGRINELENSLQTLSSDELRAKTFHFKERLSQGEALDSLLPEAFAVVREASKRVLGMRHFDSQLIGGVVLHEGKIAEMKTGEGKTLVATLPVYLNALEGKGVHVITVNDYLARRDSEWMGQLYKFLDLSVGVIVHGLDDAERQENYRADVTYGTNNEYGFDYLRDNMKFELSQYVQRDLNYAIVDEVDSILIDEARTPLIISGPTEESTDKYFRIDRIIPSLKKEADYTIDEKSRTVVLTDAGVAHVEKLLGVQNLFDPIHMETLHHVNQGLKAHTLFKRDVDYVVKDGEVMIVDEFTGRLMPGRRWSDGLHQAIEAKEKVNVENENQTLATITFQNYFRMYKKLAGMTGTADTEAAEFSKIYNLDVMVIPTHRPMVRKDHPDMIYKNERGKFKAVGEEVVECHERGQPVLVGTISIEKSEVLSAMLSRRGIKHHVLNAKHHEKEAEIVAQAGRFKAVTISTNMAGRGTDILLGGNPEFLAKTKVGKEGSSEEYEQATLQFKKICEEEKKQVVEAGGLHIIGTERHESRRIDNQLRGRAGRQGDPGSSRFYISLEDDLMRIFGSDRIASMMDKLGMEEDEPIFHPWISKAIENAQKKVEAHNFDIRKNVIEYDDVMNQQRATVYKLRREILASNQPHSSVEGEAPTQASMIDTKEKLTDMLDQIAQDISFSFEPDKNETWDLKGMNERIFKLFGYRLEEIPHSEEMNSDQIGEIIFNKALDFYEEKEKKVGAEILRHIERVVLLQTLDTLWKDHLLNMDHLREGIGLRGYAQKDPIVEYKREGFALFESLITQMNEDVVEKLFHVQIEHRDAQELEERHRPQPMYLGRGNLPSLNPLGSAQGKPADSKSPPPAQPAQRQYPKVGRNEPCPCGSQEKYKKCHGK